MLDAPEDIASEPIIVSAPQNMSFVSQNDSPEESDDSSHLPLSDQSFSELESILAGCIHQLEELKKNTLKTNIEMDALEITLQKEEADLEEEYHTRKKSIEYRKKHIDDTRSLQ